MRRIAVLLMALMLSGCGPDTPPAPLPQPPWTERLDPETAALCRVYEATDGSDIPWHSDALLASYHNYQAQWIQINPDPEMLVRACPVIVVGTLVRKQTYPGDYGPMSAGHGELTTSILIRVEEVLRGDVPGYITLSGHAGPPIDPRQIQEQYGGPPYVGIQSNPFTYALPGMRLLLLLEPYQSLDGQEPFYVPLGRLTVDGADCLQLVSEPWKTESHFRPNCVQLMNRARDLAGMRELARLLPYDPAADVHIR